jgi:predicted hydrocarbon binding protein
MKSYSSKNDLGKLLHEGCKLAKDSLKIKADRVRMLPGLKTPYNYIVIELKKSNQLMTVVEHLEWRQDVVEFENDTSMHVTIAKTSKFSDNSEVNEELCGSVSDILEGLLHDYTSSIEVIIESIECYDGDRNLLNELQVNGEEYKIAA